MATNFFLIGYHFEEFRSQVAIRKKINFTPCNFLAGEFWGHDSDSMIAQIGNNFERVTHQREHVNEYARYSHFLISP